MMIWLKQYAVHTMHTVCIAQYILRAFVMGTTAWAGSGKTLVEIQKQGEVQGKKTEEEETPRETVDSRFSGPEMDSCGIKRQKTGRWGIKR